MNKHLTPAETVALEAYVEILNDMAGITPGQLNTVLVDWGEDASGAQFTLTQCTSLQELFVSLDEIGNPLDAKIKVIQARIHMSLNIEVDLVDEPGEDPLFIPKITVCEAEGETGFDFDQQIADAVDLQGVIEQEERGPWGWFDLNRELLWDLAFGTPGPIPKSAFIETGWAWEDVLEDLGVTREDLYPTLSESDPNLQYANMVLDAIEKNGNDSNIHVIRGLGGLRGRGDSDADKVLEALVSALPSCSFWYKTRCAGINARLPIYVVNPNKTRAVIVGNRDAYPGRVLPTVGRKILVAVPNKADPTDMEDWDCLEVHGTFEGQGWREAMVEEAVRIVGAPPHPEEPDEAPRRQDDQGHLHRARTPQSTLTDPL